MPTKPDSAATKSTVQLPEDIDKPLTLVEPSYDMDASDDMHTSPIASRAAEHRRGSASMAMSSDLPTKGSGSTTTVRQKRKSRTTLAQGYSKKTTAPVTLTALYNQLHKMGQNPRQAPKQAEILVKCPRCPSRAERHNYTAHLDKKSGEFFCTKCLTRGTWSEYKDLVAKNPHFHLESAGHFVADRPNTKPRSESSTDPFERPVGNLPRFVQNLEASTEVYEQLTSANGCRLTPVTLRAYLVGLTYRNPHPATEPVSTDTLPSNPSKPAHPTHTQPFLVFPRTALNDAKVTGMKTKTSSSTKSDATAEPSNDLGDNAADEPVILADPRAVSLPIDLEQFQVTRYRCTTWPESDHVIFDPVRNFQPGLFGYHLSEAATDTIVLTSRELDAMAAYQATGIVSMALPSNSYQLPLEEMRSLERFSRIYVWLDDDLQGQEAAMRIVNKLGIDRCLLISSRGGSTSGPLNASEALVKDYDFQAILDKARPMGHDQIMDFTSLRDAVHQEILHPMDVAGVQSRDFPQYNAILKGLRPGELTIISGTTGVGKTTLLSHLSLDFCQSGVSTLWGSFEIPNVRLAKKMLYQLANKDLSRHSEEFDYWADRFEQLPLYFLKFFGSTEAHTVVDALKHAVYAYDVQHVLIDNLQFMMTGQGRGYEKWDLQEMALNTFRQFATENNVHVSLVVHPRKERDERGKLDINSIFGSAKITQDADNVVLIQKVGEVAASKANEYGDAIATRYLDIQKNRFDGTLGKIYLSFNDESLRICSATAPPRTKNSSVVRRKRTAAAMADIADETATEPAVKPKTTTRKSKAQAADSDASVEETASAV
ncbi:hypothetical protein H4R35_002827 [Dimargaris xerosporica]|nr:hypothetical protein H4R35_002827 [Dimargaris xerosporica]